jgi:intracellular protein transport protein USO1
MLLLQFPSELTLDSEYATPQEFALQFWSPQKAANVTLIVSILSVFAKGPSSDSVASAIQRLLVEMALASNAPTNIKMQAIRGLPSNPTSQLATLVLTPYAPVPNSNGEEWDRLEHTSALSALVDLVLDGMFVVRTVSKNEG